MSAEFVEELEKGFGAWQELSEIAGLNVALVFLRRSLIPFTNIPRHVSQHHELESKLSLFAHLEQAHNAFVFGSPLAAVALMRSIAEVVLERHYGASGQGLGHLINSVDGLPFEALRLRLRELKDLADGILHFNEKRARVPASLGKEILSLLLALRTLIESAPDIAPDRRSESD